VEIVRGLLQAGAGEQPDEYGEGGTALHLTAAGGFPEVVQTLLEAGFTADARDGHGMTPLGKALSAEMCSPEIVRFLLEKGADPGKAVSETRLTGFALWRQLAPACLQALLEARAIPADLRDPAWGTPLLVACAHRGAAVRALLAAGADPGIRDLDGRTALMEAARLGSMASMRALLAAGAGPDAVAMNGTTALLQGILAARQEAIPPLLAAGADPNQPDRQGRTALMLGPKKEFVGGTDVVAEVIRPLLAAGADPNRRDRYGRTALMYAVGKKWDSSYREGIQPLEDKGNPDAGKLVDALLAAGAQPDLADDKGRTALMYAAEACSVDATNSLIDAGASVHQKDKKGHSFVDIFNRSERWYQRQVIQHQEVRKAKSGGKSGN
jgi:ankyrin repeat protein